MNGKRNIISADSLISITKGGKRDDQTEVFSCANTCVYKVKRDKEKASPLF